MISRVLFLRCLIVSALFTMAVPASADPRQLGSDYRRLLSNYHITGAIARQCPELEMPEMVAGSQVARGMQEKIGIEAYANLSMAIQKSDLRKDALATVDKLFEQMDGCSDERLPGVLERIASVHSETYERFEKAEAVAKPQNVPVPLRRN